MAEADPAEFAALLRDWSAAIVADDAEAINRFVEVRFAEGGVVGIRHGLSAVTVTDTAIRSCRSAGMSFCIRARRSGVNSGI